MNVIFDDVSKGMTGITNERINDVYDLYVDFGNFWINVYKGHVLKALVTILDFPDLAMDDVPVVFAVVSRFDFHYVIIVVINVLANKDDIHEIISNNDVYDCDVYFDIIVRTDARQINLGIKRRTIIVDRK